MTVVGRGGHGSELILEGASLDGVTQTIARLSVTSSSWNPS